jgi:hypothetical protein
MIKKYGRTCSALLSQNDENGTGINENDNKEIQNRNKISGYKS